MTVPLRYGEVYTTPSSSIFVAGEVKFYSYNAAPGLATGQSVSNPSAVVLNEDTRSLVTGAASVAGVIGAVISVRVTGLTRGKTYELQIAFDRTVPRVTGERTVRLHQIVCV